VTLLASILLFVNHLPEDGQYRPKNLGRVSYIYEPIVFYCCAVVGVNVVDYFIHGTCIFLNLLLVESFAASLYVI
jgi:hypothetical protein